jgi:SPX domain protein involved in polyphosphate accumulation
MKFSHSIQFNAVPDWSSHYIAYSNLKKLYGFQGILAGVFVEANPWTLLNRLMDS